jgi:hypothetical protein
MQLGVLVVAVVPLLHTSGMQPLLRASMALSLVLLPGLLLLRLLLGCHLPARPLLDFLLFATPPSGRSPAQCHNRQSDLQPCDTPALTRRAPTAEELRL